MPHKRWWQERVTHECNDYLNHWMLKAFLGNTGHGDLCGQIIFYPWADGYEILLAREDAIWWPQILICPNIHSGKVGWPGEAWTSRIVHVCFSGLNLCCLLFSDTFLVDLESWSYEILFKSCLNHVFHYTSPSPIACLSSIHPFHFFLSLSCLCVKCVTSSCFYLQVISQRGNTNECAERSKWCWNASKFMKHLGSRGVCVSHGLSEEIWDPVLM